MYLAGSDLQELVGGDVAARFQQLVGQDGDVDTDTGHLRRRSLTSLLNEVSFGAGLRRPRRHVRAAL